MEAKKKKQDWAAIEKSMRESKVVSIEPIVVDEVGICPNCEQYQRRSNGGDCVNECVRRGFASSAKS